MRKRYLGSSLFTICLLYCWRTIGWSDLSRGRTFNQEWGESNAGCVKLLQSIFLSTLSRLRNSRMAMGSKSCIQKSSYSIFYSSLRWKIPSNGCVVIHSLFYSFMIFKVTTIDFLWTLSLLAMGDKGRSQMLTFNFWFLFENRNPFEWYWVLPTVFIIHMSAFISRKAQDSTVFCGKAGIWKRKLSFTEKEWSKIMWIRSNFPFSIKKKPRKMNGMLRTFHSDAPTNLLRKSCRSMFPVVTHKPKPFIATFVTLLQLNYRAFVFSKIHELKNLNLNPSLHQRCHQVCIPFSQPQLVPFALEGLPQFLHHWMTPH